MVRKKNILDIKKTRSGQMHRYRSVRFARHVANRALGGFDEDLPDEPILPTLDPIDDASGADGAGNLPPVQPSDPNDDWSGDLPPLPPLDPAVDWPGAETCSSGPAFWCASDENFRDCIQSRGYQGSRADFDACRNYGNVCSSDVAFCSDGSTVGRDPANNCNFAPCGNGSERVCPEDFTECEDGRRMPRDPQNDCQFQQCPEAVGECAQGPAFWCSSDENFNRCVGANGYAGDRASLTACRPYLPTPLPPAPPAPPAPVPNPCTRGPDYWSQENFDQCVTSTRPYAEFCASYLQPPAPVPAPVPVPSPAPVPMPIPSPDDDDTVIDCPHCGEVIRRPFGVENYIGQNQTIYQFRNYQCGRPFASDAY